MTCDDSDALGAELMAAADAAHPRRANQMRTAGPGALTGPVRG
jgi:hypothetical protein